MDKAMAEAYKTLIFRNNIGIETIFGLGTPSFRRRVLTELPLLRNVSSGYC